MMKKHKRPPVEITCAKGDYPCFTCKHDGKCNWGTNCSAWRYWFYFAWNEACTSVTGKKRETSNVKACLFASQR